MDFSLSEEQSLLGESVARYLKQRYPFDHRREIAASAEGWSRETWRGLADDLGLLSLAMPGDGTTRADPIDLMITMEAIGDALLIEPFFETVLVAGGVLRRTGDTAALRTIANGERTWAFAWAEPTSRYRFRDVETIAHADGDTWLLDGRKATVVAAPWADTLIVTARTSGEVSDETGISLFAVDRRTPGVTLHAYPTIDGRCAADIAFDAVRLPATALLGPRDAALPIIEQVGDEAIAALCAEAVGAMRRLHRDTIDYTRQRQQFGKPIAEFQAIQHRLVDMLMKIELASAATIRATLHLGADPVERARAASAAKAVVDDSARFVGENAVQLHGGMGMTDELPVGHYFKRLLAIAADFGTRDYHLTRYAALPARV